MRPLSRILPRLFAGLLLAAGAVAAVVTVGEVAERRVAADLADDARQRAEIYAQSLVGAIKRFGYLPAAAGLDGDVARLLATPGNAALTDRVNRYLNTLNHAAGASVLYLLNERGVVVASSNWDTPESYVGYDFSFRPYFIEGLRDGESRFYAVGTATGVPGYFMGTAVGVEGARRGVVVTKVNLDTLEAVWRAGRDRVLVTDGNGIVFLASEPALKFHATLPLGPEALERMAVTRQYGLDAFSQLSLGEASGTTGVLRSDVAPGVPLVAARKPLDGEGWNLLLYANATPALLAARAARIGMALSLALLAVAGFAWAQRLRRAREARAARAALEAAHDRLEGEVAARTADLREANDRLAGEIEEHRRTQDELIQAAKMATLGQMATGISHELNQPLTALRGLAENAAKLMARGREEEAEASLGQIGAMVERLGKITGQLRSFARRSGVKAVPVDLPAVVAESLAILAPRMRATGVPVTTALEPEARMVCFEPIRLAQIVVNLVGNALDATRGEPGAAVTLIARRMGDSVVLTVEDNGPGLPPGAVERLFEPFFTTKPAGEGLGLGLPISLAIAREFGATLTARPCPEGGLAFDLTMAAAVEKELHRAS